MAVIGSLASAAVADAAPAVSAERGGTALVSSRTAGNASVVVAPGETLWGIATREMPGRDPREALVELRRTNGLEGAEVVAGQRLVIPAPPSR